MWVRRFLVAALVLLSSTAQAFQFALNGYYKVLGVGSQEMATADPYYGLLNRVRIDTKAVPIPGLEARVVLDNEVTAGSWVKTAEFASLIAERNEPYLNLSWEPIYEKQRFYGVSLYRAYLRYDYGPILATAGRQKIDWGVLRLLSPEDLATPLTFFQVERDEKTGIDGASVEVRLPEEWRAHVIYAAYDSWNRSRVGLRITHAVGRFQISGLGGHFLRDRIAGLDCVGDIGDAGIRGELLHFWGAGSDNFIQGGIGADYAFAENWYAAVEYLYNGQGTGVFNPLRLATLTTSNRIKTLYRHFVSGQIKYDITPLLTATATGITDLEGMSQFANPELRYEIFSWLVAAAGGQFPFGKRSSEFERIPSLSYLTAQLYF